MRRMDYCGVIPQDLAIGALWPQIAALVEQALPYGRGEYEIEDVRAGIEAGSLFALGIADGATLEFVVICTVVAYPRKRVLYVIYGAGHGGARMRATITGAAKSLRCDWIETRCREGVARLYHRVGFDTRYQVCILETQT